MTTLKTITTTGTEQSDSGVVSTALALPENPNFPWGKDSPVHRHQNVSDLGVGIGIGDGGLAPREEWSMRWKHLAGRLKALWHRQSFEVGEEE